MSDKKRKSPSINEQKAYKGCLLTLAIGYESLMNDHSLTYSGANKIISSMRSAINYKQNFETQFPHFRNIDEFQAKS